MEEEAGTLESVLDERRARESEPEAVQVDEPQDAPADEVEAEEPVLDDEPADDGEADPEPASTVDAPHYWTAEHKARFAELPADLQAILAEQERGRETAVQRAQQEAVEARKQATTEAERLSSVAEKIVSVVETAEAQHKRIIPDLGMAWDEVDWPQWFQQDRATAASFRAQYDLEQSELQRLQSARQQAEALEFDQFVKAEAAKIPELVPALVDPKDGPRRFAEVQAMLLERGIPQDRLRAITAAELSIAYDAMQWRQAQAKAQAIKSAPRNPQAAPAPRPVRPTGAVVQTNSVIKDLEARVARTGSIDDVLALRRARRKG